MSISNNILSNTVSQVYSSTGNSAITTMYFCNLSPNTLSVNVHLVPFLQQSGLGPSWLNIFYSNLSILSNDTYIVATERLLLSDGDAIWADASGDGNVVVTISSIGI